MSCGQFELAAQLALEAELASPAEEAPDDAEDEPYEFPQSIMSATPTFNELAEVEPESSPRPARRTTKTDSFAPDSPSAELDQPPKLVLVTGANKGTESNQAPSTARHRGLMPVQSPPTTPCCGCLVLCRGQQLHSTPVWLHTTSNAIHGQA